MGKYNIVKMLLLPILIPLDFEGICKIIFKITWKKKHATVTNTCVKRTKEKSRFDWSHNKLDDDNQKIPVLL